MGDGPYMETPTYWPASCRHWWLRLDIPLFYTTKCIRARIQEGLGVSKWSKICANLLDLLIPPRTNGKHKLALETTKNRYETAKTKAKGNQDGKAVQYARAAYKTAKKTEQAVTARVLPFE